MSADGSPLPPNSFLKSTPPLPARFRETLECRLRPWQEKYHEMGQDVVNLRELHEDSIKVRRRAVSG